MLQPGRSYTNGSEYRYGFNGKEKDNEVKGEGNQQDYGMRIYDPRLGRFLSEDPITKEYPELTPYQFASDNPTQNIDIDGLEAGAANGAGTTASKPAILETPSQQNAATISTIQNAPLRKTLSFLTGIADVGNSLTNPLALIPTSKPAPPSLRSVIDPVGISNGPVNIAQDLNSWYNGDWSAGGRALTSIGLSFLGGKTQGNVGKRSNAKSGFGDLTKVEVKKIQNVVNTAERPIEIVGSAVTATRRGVGTNKPIGKGTGTKSDIDYVAPPSSIPYFDQTKLPGIDPNTGIIPGYGNVFQSPIIRFEPYVKPVVIPKQN